MAEAAGKVLASRLMIYEAAKSIDDNDPDRTVIAAMAKKCNF